MVAACALECVGACVRRYVLARCYVRASMHVRNAWVRASVGVCVRASLRACVGTCVREGGACYSISIPTPRCVDAAARRADATERTAATAPSGAQGVLDSCNGPVLLSSNTV